MCRRIEEEVEPTVGLPRHRHFVGFFNVSVQTPTRDPPFYGYSEMLNSHNNIRFIIIGNDFTYKTVYKHFT